MSTQYEVVSEVRAESALENDAATMPMVKNTTTAMPSSPEAAKAGSSWSPEASTPVRWASIMSSTPRERNSALAGRNATP